MCNSEVLTLCSDQMGAFINKQFGVDFNNTNMISTATSASFHSSAQIKSSVFQIFLNNIADRLDRISFVQSFDIRFDEQRLIIEWVTEPYEANIRKSNIRKEVALFQANQLSIDDLELSGIRTVISEEEYIPPTKTLLIVKPRHQVDTKTTLNYTFDQPIGLHPTLLIKGLNTTTTPSPPFPECELFMYSDLPNTLFFDKYQYDTSRLSLLSAWGEDDLEAPEWKVARYGSAQLFHITNTTSDIELKLHSRYIIPSASSTFDLLTPEVFWACDADDYMEKEDRDRIDGNPFESYGLGYESFFEPSTVFYHLKKSQGKLEYTIPTGDKEDFPIIQKWTAAVVLIATFYLLWKLWKAFISLETKNGTEKKEK